MPTSFRDISLDYKLKKFMEGIPFPIEQANFLWKGAFRPEEKNAVLTPAYQWHENGYRDYQSLEPYLKSFNGKGLLDKLLFLDTHVYMQDDILAKVDSMSMANSLEVRVPFLDYTVAEFAAKLPESFKLKGWFQPKYILKQSMKQDLPAEILRRKKKGFGIPFAVWVAEALLKNFVLDFFAEPKIRQEGIFNFESVKQILDDHFAQKRDNRKLIWTLLVFMAWYREVQTLKSK
jgi:asparagine synthase (glutamine-hydrolysing)